ncbi:hypothetical protein NM208_g8553 [Fusarium decemcellulare]|uniref:Uncharacterized protein n=1 Tax=Fusarium decemcellulare TaxID=57161 RepID=A0ACC1S506_9HYPO|nr:hypothetical protein NM208_g8553 [Fusarium decemcellulare]
MAWSPSTLPTLAQAWNRYYRDTDACPGTITAPITITGGDGTVTIETPVPETPVVTQAPPTTVSGPNGVTIYQSYTGTGTITAPITVTRSDGTVVIFTPPPFKLISTSSEIAEPTTVSGNNGYVTIYTPYPGPGEITAPLTFTQQTPSGDRPGTIIIETPVPRSPTSSQAVDQPTSATSADVYVTIYTPYPGPGEISSPITIVYPPFGGQPGTILIETPVPQSATATETYVTIYTPFPGPGEISSPITIIQPPSGGQPGTVLIETPVPRTPTPTQSGAPSTTTPGPDRYVTIYTPYPGPGTITAPITITQPPSGGQPGTILIETPAPLTTNPSDIYPHLEASLVPFSFETPAPPTSDAPTQTTSQTSAGPITVPPGPTGTYVTIYRPYPGPDKITAPITITQPPSGGQPGTIIIETPTTDVPTQTTRTSQTSQTAQNIQTTQSAQTTQRAQTTQSAQTQTTPGGTVTVPTASDRPYVTIYRPYPGPDKIDHPITITQPPASGQPGTIIIETPTPVVNTKFAGTTPVTISTSDAAYVTVYRPHTGDPITAPITVTTIAPSGGQPGTVIIETPAPAVSTVQPTTSSPPITSQGQDGYVTVYRPHTGDPITAPITVTTIAPSGGQPGTVIIETPAPLVSTQSQTPAPQTTANPPVTIPADDGGYVTIYRPYPGPGTITAPLTVGTISPSGGQPGTIIIETPGPQSTLPPAVTSSEGQDGYITVFQPYPGPGVITAPITVTTISPSGGQQGTVIIQTPVPQTTLPPPVTIPEDQNGYITVYRPYTGTGIITAPITVTTISPSGGQPGTVIIETPVPQTEAPQTEEPQTTDAGPTTLPPDDQGYITVFRPYTGTGTITAPLTITTIAPSAGQPGTVIIETPVPQTPTETEPTSNLPVTIPPGPDNSYVTVYRPHTGPDQITAPVTVTTIEPSGGQPGTIIIETPEPQTPTETGDPPVTIPPGPDNSYVTVYRPHTGPDQITAPVTVTTIEPSDGQPGTIIIETPGPQTTEATTPVTVAPSPGSSYVTVYRPHEGPDRITEAITVTTIEPTNVTLSPGPEETYVTVYRPHTGVDVITAPVTITTIAPSDGQPGTVIIETPAPESPDQNPTVTLPPGPEDSYVTVFRPHTGSDVITAPITVTTIPPSGDAPGTVIIETPVQPEPTSSLDDGAPLTTSSGPTDSYITVYRPYSGVDIITSPVTVTTIPPANGQPGTVIIETPSEQTAEATTTPDTYVTVYRPHVGTDSITAPVTVTTISPSGGQPGTVIIETPDQQAPPSTTSSGPDASYITVFRPHTGTDIITAPVTITTIEPSGDQPGTVIIETPGTQAPPITTTPEAVESWITIFRAHTGTDLITAPVTVTTIFPSDGQPGTIIIETPDAQAPPSTTSAGPEATYITVFRPYSGTERITAPVTVTTIEPSGDQPGTVIIETPGTQAPPVTTAGPAPSYITIYRPYTGTGQITGDVTVTTISPSGDEPGTVIIETPGPQAPPVTTTGPIATPSYITIYRPHTGTDEITSDITVTTIPPSGDEPGTVIIETPGPQAPPITTAGPVATPSYITIYRPYTGTDEITSDVTVTTISPSGDEPGTVIIETPGPRAPPVATTGPAPIPSYITIYRPYTGTDEITSDITVTTISPQGDEPGTIIIETPGPRAPPVTTTGPAPVPSYITIYRPYTGTYEITSDVTVTTISPQGDEPGTVIIETPGPRSPPVTTSGPAPVPSYITIYRPYTGLDQITSFVTVTTIEPTDDQPGTVIIETPVPVVNTKFAGTTAAPSYVTIYRPYTGVDDITSFVTVTTIEPTGDEPGTVIIETPGPRAPPHGISGKACFRHRVPPQLGTTIAFVSSLDVLLF